MLYEMKTDQSQNIMTIQILLIENIKKRPKPFDINDPTQYPSNRDQRQKISSWI